MGYSRLFTDFWIQRGPFWLRLQASKSTQFRTEAQAENLKKQVDSLQDWANHQNAKMIAIYLPTLQTTTMNHLPVTTVDSRCILCAFSYFQNLSNVIMAFQFFKEKQPPTFADTNSSNLHLQNSQTIGPQEASDEAQNLAKEATSKWLGVEALLTTFRWMNGWPGNHGKLKNSTYSVVNLLQL